MVYMLSPSGNVLWNRTVQSTFYPILSPDGSVFYAAVYTRQPSGTYLTLAAFRTSTGTQLWTTVDNSVQYEGFCKDFGDQQAYGVEPTVCDACAGFAEFNAVCRAVRMAVAPGRCLHPAVQLNPGDQCVDGRPILVHSV